MPTNQMRVVAQGPRATRRAGKSAKDGRHDAVRLAADFLQKELAKGPALVSELEATARAAGLLSSEQHISDTKAAKPPKATA